MDYFTYAHNDTRDGERKTPTAQFNNPALPQFIRDIREAAFGRGIPTADNETVKFLQTLLFPLQPKNILELGGAIGISGSIMLHTCPNAHLTTVEKNSEFFGELEENFKKLNLSNRVTCICDDALNVITSLDTEYDFIFLDCAKVQYVKYLPYLKKLLKKGGVLLADDILLYGWLTGETQVPPKRKMLYTHIKEFVECVTKDSELTTTILNIGDGISLSVKIN